MLVVSLVRVNPNSNPNHNPELLNTPHVSVVSGVFSNTEIIMAKQQLVWHAFYYFLIERQRVFCFNCYTFHLLNETELPCIIHCDQPCLNNKI